ncbi:hypothetical protein SESBI_29028 [Sesbania bispinosa]|nr:hypothetical protein SESBI_29028 [Sesbania bispinosa]
MVRPGNYTWRKGPLFTRQTLLAASPATSNRLSNLSSATNDQGVDNVITD